MVTSEKLFPAIVNKVLENLLKINPFYNYVTIDNEWEDINEQSHQALWKILTTRMSGSRNSDQTDSHDNIDGNSKSKERKLKESSSPFPAVMYNVEELIGRHLCFLKTLSQEETTLMVKDKF